MRPSAIIALIINNQQTNSHLLTKMPKSNIDGCIQNNTLSQLCYPVLRLPKLLYRVLAPLVYVPRVHT